VVGEGSGLPSTNLMALKPAGGYSWRYDNAGVLSVALEERQIRALVLDDQVTGNPDEPWVRVAMPFLSDWTEAGMLARKLKSLVQTK
jgi:hypothetical protein